MHDLICTICAASPDLDCCHNHPHRRRARVLNEACIRAAAQPPPPVLSPPPAPPPLSPGCIELELPWKTFPFPTDLATTGRNGWRRKGTVSYLDLEAGSPTSCGSGYFWGVGGSAACEYALCPDGTRYNNVAEQPDFEAAARWPEDCPCIHYPPPSSPPPFTCVTVHAEHKSCWESDQGDFFGTFGSPAECGFAAKAAGCSVFMWSGYSISHISWGCRCCINPAAAVYHGDWSLYNAACPSPSLPPRDFDSDGVPDPNPCAVARLDKV